MRPGTQDQGGGEGRADRARLEDRSRAQVEPSPQGQEEACSLRRGLQAVRPGSFPIVSHRPCALRARRKAHSITGAAPVVSYQVLLSFSLRFSISGCSFIITSIAIFWAKVWAMVMVSDMICGISFTILRPTGDS